jgi:uncharacterized protein
MPANLPPEYFEAEKKYKQSGTTSEKISALEELIATVPKHKGTDKLRADLRKRLSQLRKEAMSKKKGGRGDLNVVQKEGSAQIVLVGFPNSGKSSILASLTNASPVIADYPLSTLIPLPGMMPFEDIQIQLIDLPPLGNEATDGWVSGILRYSDALLLVLDLSEDPEVQAELLIEQIERWNIQPVSYVLSLTEVVQKRNVVLKRTLLAGNKADVPDAEENFIRLRARYGSKFPCIAVSAKKKENLEQLKKELFNVAGIIRVYSKPPGKDPDLSKPFSIPTGSTVLDLAKAIHKDFVGSLKYAWIWGSARFDGQRVEKTYVLKDRDVVEFHV